MGWAGFMTLMPKKGGCLDIGECDYAPLVDVVDFRRAYIERSKSIVTGSTAVKGWEQMDEHERLQSEYFQEQMKMKCMVVDGKMTVKKYREWKGKHTCW